MVEGLTSGGPLPTGRARRRDRRGICAGTAESGPLRLWGRQAVAALEWEELKAKETG